MRRKKFPGQAGFTLIEVMIAVVIVGILTAIALPNYSEYIRRSERLEARTTLFEAASWMERKFSVENSYLTFGGYYPKIPDGLNHSPKTGNPKYLISVKVANGTTYKLQALPQANPPDKCGTFILDETGARSLDDDATASVEECWR